MKKAAVLFLVSAVLCMSAACTGGAGRKGAAPEAVFSGPRLLAPDSIAVAQVIKPYAMRVVDGKMIVPSSGTDTIFYVYALPDFRYLYSGVVRGEGPGDLPSPGAIRTGVSADGRRFVADMRSRGLARLYSLQPQGVRWTDTLVYRRGYELWAAMEGGRALLGTKPSFKDPDQYLMATCGDSLSVVTDSLKTLTACFRVGGGGSLILNSPVVTALGDAVALAYSLVPRIEFYRLDAGGKLLRQAAWGDSLQTHKASDFEGPQWFKALENDPFYYLQVDASGDHFYAFYRGTTQGQYEQDPFAVVQVFDRQGRPVTAFRINGNYQMFAVDEPHGTIYAVDALKDFDWVYTFAYRLP